MAIGANLLRYNKAQKYLIWDIESEGLNHLYSRGWQLSFIVCTLDEVLESHDYFIWYDDLRMSRDAARITRFNFDEYKAKARPKEEVLEIFDKYLWDESLIPSGHNVIAFDSMIYNVLRRSCGKQPTYDFNVRMIDTLALSRAYKLGIKPDISSPEAFLSFQMRMLNAYNKKMKTSLSAMAKEFNIQFESNELHRADVDILLNKAILKELVWKAEV